MTTILSLHQVRLLRLKAQRLLPTDTRQPDSPARVLKDIIGVQAQDLPAALFSIRARSTGLTASQVDQARQSERSIVWTSCMRGTMHLVAAEDVGWLISLLGPDLIAGDRRRLHQLGWDEASAATGIHLLQEALKKRGNLTRSEIVDLLEKNGLPFKGQAPVHLLYRAVLEGLICIGPDRKNKPTYVLAENWLGKSNSLPREVALAEIARRYLAAYGPAEPEDLASWSGLKLTEARQAWQLITDLIIQVTVLDQPSWLLKSHQSWLDESFDPQPIIRLLPRFDTYLLGYANRDLVVEPAYVRRIHPGGGLISPVLLVDGQALGIWKTRRRSAYLEVWVQPFQDLATSLLPLIEAEVADLGRFLGEKAVLVMENPP